MLKTDCKKEGQFKLINAFVTGPSMDFLRVHSPSIELWQETLLCSLQGIFYLWKTMYRTAPATLGL